MGERIHCAGGSWFGELPDGFDLSAALGSAQCTKHCRFHAALFRQFVAKCGSDYGLPQVGLVGSRRVHDLADWIVVDCTFGIHYLPQRTSLGSLCTGWSWTDSFRPRLLLSLVSHRWVGAARTAVFCSHRTHSGRHLGRGLRKENTNTNSESGRNGDCTPSVPAGPTPQ